MAGPMNSAALGAQQAQQAADVLKKKHEQAEQQDRDAVRRDPKIADETVWLPGGLGVNVRPFIEARRRMHKRQSEFFDHPERLLKKPDPNCHYGWARQGAPLTTQRAAEGAYRYVKPTEVDDLKREAFTTHKGASGEQVYFGTLVLVEIPEQAWQDYYIGPEIEGVARLASQQAQLAAEVEEISEGRVKATSETTVEKDIVPLH